MVDEEEVVVHSAASEVKSKNAEEPEEVTERGECSLSEEGREKGGGGGGGGMWCR